VRGRERLVDVVVHHVEPHVAGATAAEQGVEVRAVVVEESARVVHDVGDLRDVALEEPDRVRVGQHERGGVVADGRLKRLDVDSPVVAGWEFDHVVARQRGGREVRPVRGGGDHDLGPVVAVVLVVRLRDRDTGELAGGARGRLERRRPSIPRSRRGTPGAGTAVRGSPARPAAERSGWIAAFGSTATSSVNFGLYFIVQLPSGYGPESIAQVICESRV